jgi:hypothetical protein
MIKSEAYGGGHRWYCECCDVRYNEYSVLTIQWTNGTPPAECTRCEEPAMLVMFSGMRPSFASPIMLRREAAEMQRMMQGGGVYSVERGRELKRQMVERRG